MTKDEIINFQSCFNVLKCNFSRQLSTIITQFSSSPLIHLLVLITYKISQNIINTCNLSGEMAMKKKTLCVKFVSKSLAKSYITEVSIFSRTKRMPAGYTLVR